MAAQFPGAVTPSPYAAAPAAPQAFDPAAMAAPAPQGPPQGMPMFGCGPAQDTVQFGNADGAEEAPAPDAPAEEAPAEKGDGYVARLTQKIKDHYEGAGKNPVKWLWKTLTLALTLPFKILGALKKPKAEGGEDGGEA